MKKALAVLSLCGSMLPLLAQADELDVLTDRLLKDAPMKCFDEASTISNTHVRRVLPDLLLNGMREAENLGPDWQAGNESYQQARELVEMTLQHDESSNGPMVDITPRSVVRTAVGNWTPAQRVEYSAFLKQKGGRLVWSKVMDAAMCLSLIKSVSKPPLSLPAGSDQKRLQVLEIGVLGVQATMDMEFGLLPSDQRAKAQKIVPVLSESLLQAFRTVHQVYPARAGQAFQSAVPALLKIADASKQ